MTSQLTRSICIGLAVGASSALAAIGSPRAHEPATMSPRPARIGAASAADRALEFSSYLGGSDGSGYVSSVAIAPDGGIVVAGTTEAGDFPTAGGGVGSTGDLFVSKLSADGSTLVYSTLIEAGFTGRRCAVTVDAAGHAYLTGSTDASHFPIVDAVQPAPGGQNDAFVVELSTTGDIVFSTYLGGTYDDDGSAIAVDATGAIYVAGSTGLGGGFPIVSAVQRYFGGGFSDGFVTKLLPHGAGIAYSTFLGGRGEDTVSAIALDGAGNAYVAGITNSFDFPVKNAVRDRVGNDPSEGFVAELGPRGSSLEFSTYLGGSGADRALGIALDLGGRPVVVGDTTSPDFPTHAAEQPHLASPDGVSTDGFVTVFAPGGRSIAVSTFVGGERNDVCWGVAADPSGGVVFCGSTTSRAFPVANPLQSRPALASVMDAVVGRLDESGALTFASYFGSSDLTAGTTDEVAYGIATDPDGGIALAGQTPAANFPLVNPIPGTGGGVPRGQGWVAKIGSAAETADLAASLAASVPEIYRDEQVTFTTVVTNTGPGPALDLRARVVDPSGVGFASAQASQGGEPVPPFGFDHRSVEYVWPGTTPPGASRTLAVVYAPSSGTLNRTAVMPIATASCASPEARLDDNAATATCVVHSRITTHLAWTGPTATTDPRAPVDYLLGSEVSYKGAELASAAASPREDVLGYRVYRSDQPHVDASSANLFMSLPATASELYVDGGFDGSYFVVTVVYASGESVRSNEVSAGLGIDVGIAGATVTDTKLKVEASASGAPALRFELDGVAFVAPPKSRRSSAYLVYTQKGRLANGETIAEHLRRRDGRRVAVTIREPNGAILTLVERS